MGINGEAEGGLPDLKKTNQKDGCPPWTNMEMKRKAEQTIGGHTRHGQADRGNSASDNLSAVLVPAAVVVKKKWGQQNQSDCIMNTVQLLTSYVQE